MALEDYRKTQLEKRKELLMKGELPYPATVKRTHMAAEADKEFTALKRQEKTAFNIDQLHRGTSTSVDTHASGAWPGAAKPTGSSRKPRVDYTPLPICGLRG